MRTSTRSGRLPLRPCTTRQLSRAVLPKTMQPRYHRNQQYSIVGLTNAAGTLVERYTYTAYGTLSIHAPDGTSRGSSSYNTRYTYTGREYDPELGLYHFRARWYDPATGGFISRDPLGYVDGMSLYRAYFGVKWTDPNGTELRIPEKDDRTWMLLRIAELCPEGNPWTVDSTGLVTAFPGFCSDTTRIIISNGCLREVTCSARVNCARHKVSCKCLCDAISTTRIINLFRQSDPGGFVVGMEDVYVGEARPKGYPGTGATNPPEPGRVPGPSWIILGHELCGHAVPMLRHPTPGDPKRYTDEDPVIIIENEIRKEHSCSDSCRYTERVDWGHRLGASQQTPTPTPTQIPN